MLTLSSGEKDFIRQCFEHNCRPDGRTKYDRTPIEIDFSPTTLINSNGSCKLKLPDTQSLLYISAKAEIENTIPGNPNSGIVELQISSSKISELPLNKANHLKTKLADMTHFVKTGLLDYIPLDKLCLLEGALCWKIYLDVFVLGELEYNHLGNFF
jgi:exosome complex RNA-binding protein Rrp42 (RNase PH superfamily)